MGDDGRSSDLQVGSRVFVHGLASEAGSPLNFRCGEVVKAQEDGRLGVRVTGVEGAPKLIKRMNLLSASRTEVMQMFRALILWSLAAAGTCEEALVAYTFAGRGSSDAIQAVLSRVLGLSPTEVVKAFDLKIVANCSRVPPSARTELCFELSDAEDGRIRIAATSGPELAYGASWYLRTRCNMSFSWNRTGGNQVSVPKSWPGVGGKIIKYRKVPMSYFNNVVTFSYSYTWYSFKDWEAWLDWAVLSGVNLVIAYTGQEEIYRKTFNAFGVNNSEFASWSNGAAWLAWSRGQSMHGIGSSCGDGCMPLPFSWMTGQWELQKEILRRSRSLGLVSVLPSFQGNIPPIFRQLYPQANISKTGAAWLDDLDPLFGKIQQRYMEIMIKDWGTDHWYETDGYFNQNQGPWARSHTEGRPWQHSEDVPVDPDAYAHAQAAYQSMSKVDPEAVWLYQGWIWRDWGEDKLPFMKGFVSAVPPKHFVMLDMFDEADPEWNKFNNFGYFGTPFIWSVLHNFGGNTGMWGSIPTLNSEFSDAFQHTASVAGTGAAPEGIDQNPFYYSFLTDLPWQTGPIDLQQWAVTWTQQRYGRSSVDAEEAFRLLLGSVYGNETNSRAIRSRGGFLAEKNADGLTALAMGGGEATPHESWYKLSDVAQAWGKLNTAAKAGVPETMRYDLVNLGREVLGKVSNRFFAQMVNATTPSEVSAAGRNLLAVLADADRLLCSDHGFLASARIRSAKSWAEGNATLERYLELAARSLTTVWTPQEPNSSSITTLCDYANRQWAGQVGGFYTLRHKCYIRQAMEDLGSKRPVNKTAFDACVAAASYDWTHDFGSAKYPMCEEPTSDVLAISQELFEKYGRPQSESIWV
ncbi:NAGLU [Symbiodinium microadriaticum]|nr:NAGLU [Symbiodinium microadriaticum]